MFLWNHITYKEKPRTRHDTMIVTNLLWSSTGYFLLEFRIVLTFLKMTLSHCFYFLQNILKVMQALIWIKIESKFINRHEQGRTEARIIRLYNWITILVTNLFVTIVSHIFCHGIMCRWTAMFSSPASIHQPMLIPFTFQNRNDL